MPNVILRGFQAFGANDEVLRAAVDEVESAVKSAKSSGKVQVVALFRKGYRHDLQIGDIYVVPPAVCDSIENFPLALLRSQIRHYATPEGAIEFELGALLDKEDMSQETLKAFKDVVFREGGEGDLKPLLVWRACWSSPWDAIGFLYTKDTVWSKLRDVAYAAPFNPALSSVFDALKSVSENHAAFCVSAPVTQHLFSVPDSEEQDYPDFAAGLDFAPPEEGGTAEKAKTSSLKRRPILRVTAANIPAMEKDALSDQELQCLAAMDGEVGQTVVSSEESGIRDSPLAGLITASEQPGTYQDNDFGKGDTGLRHQPDYGEAGSKETITPAMVDGPDYRTASIPGHITPMAEFGRGEGVETTFATAIPGVGYAPDAVLPSKFAGLVLAAPSDNQDIATDNPQADAERTASAHRAAVGDAHQVDEWGKADGYSQEHTTPGDTTTQTGTSLDFAHLGEGSDDAGQKQKVKHTAPGDADTATDNIDYSQGTSGGDMGGGTVTAAAKRAGLPADTIRAAMRFVENFGGHYLPRQAVAEELGRLTDDVKGAATFLMQEGLIESYGDKGIKVLTKTLQNDAATATPKGLPGALRGASFLIKNAFGQHWACADCGGVKLGGYWTDAEAEAHNFINEEDAHEEVRRCLLKGDGAIVMPKGIGPLPKQARSWWSPGKLLARSYPELHREASAADHVPGRRASGHHKPKRANSWFDQGTVADAMNIDQVNDNAPNFEGELSREESPDLINPFGAPGNDTPQAPVSMAGAPEGLNQEYDGVPLKQEDNFYGPEFMREFYAPGDADVDMDTMTQKQGAWLKAKQAAPADPRDGEGGALIKAWRFDNPKPYQGQLDNRSAALVEIDHLKSNPDIKKIEVYILWGGQWSLTNRWERSEPGGEWDEQAAHDTYRTASAKTALVPPAVPPAQVEQAQAQPVTIPGATFQEAVNTLFEHLIKVKHLKPQREQERAAMERLYQIAKTLGAKGGITYAGKTLTVAPALLSETIKLLGGSPAQQTPVDSPTGTVQTSDVTFDNTGIINKIKNGSLKVAFPGAPVEQDGDAQKDHAMVQPSFLDALNMAKPEMEAKVPYIDPAQNGDGIDNPSPVYLMMDKLLKGVMGAYVSQLIGAFSYTQRPLELETPFEDKLNLEEVLEFGGATTPTAVNAAKAQLSHALELLSDDEKKQLVTDGFAQGAVWCESQAGAGGYTYEVFARIEAMEGPILTLRVITGIR